MNTNQKLHTAVFVLGEAKGKHNIALLYAHV